MRLSIQRVVLLGGEFHFIVFSWFKMSIRWTLPFIFYHSNSNLQTLCAPCFRIMWILLKAQFWYTMNVMMELRTNNENAHIFHGYFLFKPTILFACTTHCTCTLKMHIIWICFEIFSTIRYFVPRKHLASGITYFLVMFLFLFVFTNISAFSFVFRHFFLPPLMNA